MPAGSAPSPLMLVGADPRPPQAAPEPTRRARSAILLGTRCSRHGPFISSSSRIRSGDAEQLHRTPPRQPARSAQRFMASTSPWTSTTVVIADIRAALNAHCVIFFRGQEMPRATVRLPAASAKSSSTRTTAACRTMAGVGGRVGSVGMGGGGSWGGVVRGRAGASPEWDLPRACAGSACRLRRWGVGGGVGVSLGGCSGLRREPDRGGVRGRRWGR